MDKIVAGLAENVEEEMVVSVTSYPVFVSMVANLVTAHLSVLKVNRFQYQLPPYGHKADVHKRSNDVYICIPLRKTQSQNFLYLWVFEWHLTVL